MNDTRPALVSIHGGHSGEFCTHADGNLEEIVQAYIRKGFKWVGITEHMPPVDNRFRYPDEIEAGLDARDLYHRFSRYVQTARKLQKKYASRITLYVGFETETYAGAYAHIERLKKTFRPDYIVGSVHHVNDVGIDWTAEVYHGLADQLGGLDALYVAYFDQQYKMLARLKPQVVGHFDLVRIFDEAYSQRLQKTSIRSRIQRNLDLIKRLGMIMDLNVRALHKGAGEPYIARPVLEQARALGIPVVPGDDSHDLATVGLYIEEGIDLLQRLGFDTDWRIPA
jgi:histidinol-phosphatase (PHP family)